MPQKLRRATLHSVARVGPRSLAPSDAGVDGARERDEARAHFGWSNAAYSALDVVLNRIFDGEPGED